MANWNRLKSLRQARTNALNAVEPPAPPEFTDIGAPPLIGVGGATTDFSFDIPGVVPQRADMFEAVILEEPVERWPARVRNPSFPIDYRGIDPDLDASIISTYGLTYEELSGDPAGDRWTTYFPLVQSDTQVYTNENSKPLTWDDGLIVGSSVVFATTEILDGTSYTVGTTVYGLEGNLQGSPSWSGVIILREDPNTMEVDITSVGSPESINVDSTTQHWYITNDANLLSNLF